MLFFNKINKKKYKKQTNKEKLFIDKTDYKNDLIIMPKIPPHKALNRINQSK